MTKSYKKINKSHKVGIVKLSILLALVAIMAVSAVAIVKLNADVGVSESVLSTYSTDDKTLSDAMGVEYSKVSQLIPVARQEMNENSFLRNQNADELFSSSKYDDNFFDTLQNLIDQNVDPNIILDFIFSILDDAEKQFISDGVNQVFSTIGDADGTNNTRGAVYIAAYFGISSAAVGGATAAGIVKALVSGALSTLVAWIISTFTAFSASAGAVVGAIIGFIAGSAVAAVVYNWVKDKLNEYLIPLGNNQVPNKGFTLTLVDVSGWLVFVSLSHTFDITAILVKLLVGALMP